MVLRSTCPSKLSTPPNMEPSMPLTKKATHKNDVFKSHCELCQVHTNTEESMAQHIQGRTHRTNLVRRMMNSSDLAHFDASRDSIKRKWVAMILAQDEHARMLSAPSFGLWAQSL